MRRLENLILSGVVALAVSAAVAPAASPLPRETSSKGDRIAALAKRVDALQVRLADTRQIAQEARTEADDATQVTGCIDSAVWNATDPTTGGLVPGDGTEPDAVLIPVMNSECAGDAS